MGAHDAKQGGAPAAVAVAGAVAGAIRSCVHCGFCLATCPTYVLGGNELDSPRGRIQLVKGMLDGGAVPSERVVRHVDRCLSCLACETTCPSGVSYRRVIDEARAYIDERYQRPWADRLLRALLANVLPYGGRLRMALFLAGLARPFAGALERVAALRPLAAMLRMSRVPAQLANGPRTARGRPEGVQQVGAERPGSRPRVGLWMGCVEPVLAPSIQESARRLLERAGLEVVQPANPACCGALPHHMGKESQGREMARAAVQAWSRELESAPLEAIVVTASGCGSMIRDFGYLLRDDPALAAKAARVSALACDISQVLARHGLPPAVATSGLVVAYHAACSLQHGQKVVDGPFQLLASAGFDVRKPAEPHLCCGSAGVYNILQPVISGQLGERKVAHLQALAPDVIATGNIGCQVQIARTASVPVVHVAQLLDWASGGPVPPGLEQAAARLAAARLAAVSPASAWRNPRPARELP